MSAKKKGKLSKAERDRIKNEEEEKRQKEEEQARLIAEQEEAERAEKERKVQEEHERLESKDRERRDDELNELRLTVEENQLSASRWHSDLRAKAKWDRYMRCDGSPDPSVPQEINTYISLWREMNDVEINDVLSQCALAFCLIDELEFLLNETPSSELNEEDVLQYKETILTLQSLIHSKHNKATEEILKHSSALADIETGNMQTVIKTKDVTLCLWANLNKNPRFKGYKFQEAGMAFELSKQLAVSDIAVRLLHTRYDHLSPPSPPLQTHTSPSIAESWPASLAESRQGQGEQEGEHGEETDSVLVAEEENQSVKSEGRKSTQSAVSVKEEASSAEMKAEGDGEKKPESPGGKTADGQDESTAAPQEREEDVMEEDAVDLHQYTPLGGVFYFDVFKLPPQPSLIKGWTITKLSETGLQVFPYPVELTPPQISGSGKLEDKEADSLTSPPVVVTITLPEGVMFLEEPQVARWDATGQQWKTDCISDVKHDKEEGKISFKMSTFHAFTLLQDSYVNMPFQSWELRPLGPNSALLTITAAISEVQITIKDDQCMLNIANTENNLSHIRGHWMTPSGLMRAMRRAGVNVFADEHSDRYVSVNEKAHQAEQAAYEQMALLSSVFAFAWSRWNAACGKDHLVIQVSEHLKTEPVAEEEWALYLLSARRSLRLKITEYSSAFEADLAEGTEFHSTFLHMVKDGISDSVLERVNQSRPLFIDCVHKLLCATRVLTYS
ncbi:dynein axonemal intermediate chain 7 isoform X1 [Amia ocellicauda]|uniref:dynein axonemal intermediate chain 7 isoform X1 n=1 Tax=Amia ocellicauda TaxID=2972642 RepID=UPI003464A4A5